METIKRRFLKAILRDMLLSAHGTAFEDLIGRYLHAVYGDDFHRARSAGARGDLGCDGYRQSTKTVYQCYGKDPSAGVDESYIVSKIKADFKTAVQKIGLDRMKQWVFVNNLLMGLPTAAVLAIAELDDRTDGVQVGQLGPDGIERLLFTLPQHELDTLFDYPSARSIVPIAPRDIQLLLHRVATQGPFLIEADPATVPRDKIEQNKISDAAKLLIIDNVKYAAQVDKFVSNSADPTFGDRVAKGMKARYKSLRLDGYSPNEIVEKLVIDVLGDDSLDLSRLKAAEAIVAYFFQTCDVFERLAGSA